GAGDAGGDGVLPHGGRRRLHAAGRRDRHPGLRCVLQEADRGGAAQERDLALRHGEDEVDDRAGDPGTPGAPQQFSHATNRGGRLQELTRVTVLESRGTMYILLLSVSVPVST